MPANTLILKAILGLYGLYGLAVIVPAIDIIGPAPQFFILYGFDDVDTLLFYLFVLLGPIAVAAPVALLANKHPVAIRAVAALFAIVLFVLAILIMLKQSHSGANQWVTLGILTIACIVFLWKMGNVRLIEFFAVVGVLSPVLVLPSAMSTVQHLYDRNVRTQLHFPGVKPPELPNVLMVIFDEFPVATLMTPDGSLNEGRFPSFSKLAQTATWFRRTGSVACYTELAVPAVLTGRNPLLKRVTPDATSYPNNLFELLADTHAIETWEPVTHLCPNSVCGNRTNLRLLPFLHHLAIAWTYSLVPKEMETKLPDLQSLWMSAANAHAHDHATYGDSVVQVSDVLASIDKKSTRPWLKAVHLELPHVPYAFSGTGQVYIVGSRLVLGARELENGALVWPSDSSVHANQNNYRLMLQAQYSDRVLGEFVRRLKETGQFDKTIIVVTADHGVSHIPGTYRRETDSANYHMTAFVPLFIKATDQHVGAIRDDFVSTIDIVPTLLRLLGAIPSRELRFDGINLFATRHAEVEELFGHACMDPKAADKSIKVEHYPKDVTAVLSREAERTDKLFGGDAEPRVQFGQYTELLGASSEQVGIDGPSDVKVTISPNWVDWNNMALDGRFLPLHLFGYVAPPLPANFRIIAAEINGHIASVVPTLFDGSTEIYSAMIDKSRLVPGKNSISVYSVETPGHLKKFRRLNLQIDPAVPPK